MLKKIIKIESENLDKFKNILIDKHENKIYPGYITDTGYLEYYHIKNEYRKTVSKLLAIRKNFSVKLQRDALPSLTTMQDDISQDEEYYDKYRVKNK